MAGSSDEQLNLLAQELQRMVLDAAREVYSSEVIGEWSDPLNVGLLAEPDGYARVQGSCGDTMEFFVANHGRPIPVEAQEHLFMAFVSGRELEKERKAMPSTGLGLTFCKLAAEAHGGKILLKSPMAKGGDGVVVTLRFPRAREDTPSGS